MIRLLQKLLLLFLVSLPISAQYGSFQWRQGIGIVTVSANANENVGVVGVQFLLDGTPLGSEDTVVPYTVSWDSSAASNGSHTLTARAHAAGNQATSPL